MTSQATWSHPVGDGGTPPLWRALALVAALVLGVPAVVAVGTAARRPAGEPEPPAAPFAAVRPALSATDSSCYDQPGPPAPAPTGPFRFTDVTRAAGLCAQQHELRRPPGCFFNRPSDMAGPKVDDAARAYLGCLDERMTGGAAVGDFDRDGSPDLYLTQLRQGPPGRLFRNNGDGTFRDVTAAAGLDGVEGNGNGAVWADLDNDGYPDLVVTTMSSSRYFLFMNNGDGTFREEGERRGVAMADGRPHRGFSVAAGDYDNDGYVDLFLTEWSNPGEWSTAPSAHARLLHNLGEQAPATFEDTTERAGTVLGVPATVPLNPAYAPYLGTAQRDEAFRTASFSAAFADLDRDGWQDLVVVSDFGTSQLFWNRGDGTFTEGTAAAGFGKEGNGMGLAVADLDGDGWIDLFVTAISQASEPRALSYTGNRAYRNLGNRTFADVTDAWGLGDGGWGWGTAAGDFDRDGRADLVMTNGQFTGMDHDIVGRAEFAATPKRLWRNLGDGRFEEVAQASGIKTTAEGKGLVTFDADGDGDLDVLVVNNGGFPTFYRNDTSRSATPAANWVGVRVTGAAPGLNADGLGAVVLVRDASGRTQVQLVGPSGYLGNSDRTLNFGLGAVTGPVDIEVMMPSRDRPRVATRPAVGTGQVVAIQIV
ncbi:MAG: CRTAC1 family protein [Actinobacteria bacterium]|nr:CRTAC1 family protein [Actinomycetota bacterium]